MIIIRFLVCTMFTIQNSARNGPEKHFGHTYNKRRIYKRELGMLYPFRIKNKSFYFINKENQINVYLFVQNKTEYTV